MKRLNLLLALAVCSVSLLAGCSDSTPAMKKSMDESRKAEEYTEPMSDSTSPESKTDMKVGMFTPTILDNGEASHITVQHVLIAFKGSVPGKNISRSKTEAETLAKEILAKAVAGEDFDALVKTHTDTRHRASTTWRTSISRRTWAMQTLPTKFFRVAEWLERSATSAFH